MLKKQDVRWPGSELPVASISIDLDNKWSYLKAHGDETWKTFPSYLEVVVPRILDFLRDSDLKITFFVVGRDARQPENRDLMKAIADEGHEIANHSFEHEPWLHLYSREQLAEELARSEAAIQVATGKSPKGFRGPGFSKSPELFELLVERGYEYDGSTFPTFLGPIARAYFFLTASFNREEKDQRKKLFGRLSEGFQPNRPFDWRVDSGALLEIPVTTMPVFKLPMHMSYLHFLGKYSQFAAKAYFHAAMRLCRLVRLGPSFLLHPTDFLGAEDNIGMDFFPAMTVPLNRKLNLLSWTLERLDRNFDVMRMCDQARVVRSQKLRSRSAELVRTVASS